MLTTCAFQLIFGKLYTYHPIKWVFLIALSIFELGSLVCAVAPTSTALIIGRAVAGLGSAGMYAGAFLIIAHSVPVRERPLYNGMIGATYGVACVIGPLLGGVFTDSPKLTWRWCFYINLPIGVFPAAIVIFFFASPPKGKTDQPSIWGRVKRMDLPGTLCFLPGVVCLLLALQWGGTRYEWSNGRVIALLVLAGVLIIGFVVIQIYSGEDATVPTRVFKNRNIWGGAILGGCINGASFVILLYVSLIPRHKLLIGTCRR
jgi:MFS family permease